MAGRTRASWHAALAGAVAAVTALFVLAIPATASAAPPEVEALLKTPSAAEVQPSPPEVAAYRKSFGVSKAEATERLKLQARGAAAHIGEALEEKLGDSYGGLWFDNEAGEYVIGLTPPGFSRGTTRTAVAAELADAGLDSGSSRIRPVGFGWAALTEARDRLREKLSSYINDEEARVGADPRSNSVVVKVPKTTGKAVAADIARLTRGAEAGVDTRKIDDHLFHPKFAACDQTARYCSQPMRGGVKLLPIQCTAGFRARGKSDGKPYLLTAAHCLRYSKEEEVTWNWLTKDPLQLYAEVGIGTLVQWHYPGNDWAKIDATNTWADASPWSMITYWGKSPNYEYSINGEGESIVGNTACHTGNTTGTTCGKILETEEEFGGGGDFFHDMALVGNTKGFCAEGGDSGGPVFASNMALGTLTFSSGVECGTGAQAIYPEIDHITSEADVALTPVSGAPGAFTNAVTGYPAPHQATASGYVYPNGVSTNYHFDHGTTLGYGSSTSSVSAGSGYGVDYKTGTLTGLKGNTTYHFRIVAENSAETAKSIDKTFKTPAWKPLVTPEAVSEVGVSEETGHAKLNAQVNPQGSSTSYRFEWGKASEGFPNKVPVPDANIGSGTSNVAVSREITGLKGQTEYHWRVVAANEEGTAESSTQTFTTPDWRPVVTTEKQTNVEVVEEEGRATLHGRVNPKGFATGYHFEWGTQAEFEAEEYGHETPEAEAGSGEEDVSVEATIKGLKGQSTYHFRLVAENVEGSGEGDDKSFTTPDWRPSVAHAAAIAVKAEDATLIVRITPKGFDTTYHLEWGTQAEFEAEEYGHEIEGESIGSGSVAVEISKQLSELTPRRAYHFRVVAENAEGVRTSEDVLFKTSTSGFFADLYPATAQGTPVSSFYVRLAGLLVECTGPSFEAELKDTGIDYPDEEAGAEIASASLTSDFQCGGFPIGYSWEMNGCNFEFDPGYGSGGSFEGEFNIGPPGCGPITSSSLACQITIPPQVGRAATYTNEGTGSSAKVRIELDINDLRYSSKASSVCTAATDAAYGELHGTWEVEAEDVAGEQIGVELTRAYLVGPEVSTEAATGVGVDRAMLNGALDTLGRSSSYRFEYGTTSEYGQTAWGESVPASEEGPAQVSRQLTGLKPDTTYHYRIVGSGGWAYQELVSYGEERTFRTGGYHPAEFEAEEYTASIGGEASAETALGFGSASISCESGQPSGSLSEAAPVLSVSVQYGGCIATVGAATVTMNSCHYDIGLSSGPPFGGPLAIACDEEEDTIEVVSAGCTLQIPPQSTSATLGYENEGQGSGASVAVEGAASGVQYTASGLCPFIGIANGEHEDGALDAAMNLNATHSGEPTGLLIGGGTRPTGVFVSGEESEEEASQPHFDAEGLPATVQSESSEVTSFTFAGKSFKCAKAVFVGDLKQAASLALNVTYTGCTSPVGAATVTMNSCHYVAQLDNSGPPYGGSLAIVCEEEGGITISASGCLLTIPGQSASGTLSYDNTGSGSTAGIEVEGSATGVQYTAKGLCPFIGIANEEHEDGTLDAEMELKGTYLG